MSGIHLFVPMLHVRDAVGEHTRTLRDLLVADGVECRIYIETPDEDTVDETRPYLEYEDDALPGDVLVYQMATRSTMVKWLRDRPEPVVVNYHSLTPFTYFAPWNNWIARHQVEATLELRALSSTAALGIGVSEFDAGELRASGYQEVAVIPVANVRFPPTPADPATVAALARRAGDGPRWLSVGRLAPNKAHEDTIAALFVARATTSPGARLTIVGSPTEPNYARALQRYATRLGIARSVDFVSRISDAELSAHYASADVLVMLSEHEGFGVPLVEAMSHGLPVVAYASGAVPEVVGDAGVLLEAKGPRRVAEMVAALLGDEARREVLVARGRSRPHELGLERSGSDLMAALRAIADRSSGVTGGSNQASPLRPGAPLSH
ncbi:MAG TPA: glycosyltransferase family 4 protein [Acidimicrobiales bacterium]